MGLDDNNRIEKTRVLQRLLLVLDDLVREGGHQLERLELQARHSAKRLDAGRRKKVAEFQMRQDLRHSEGTHVSDSVSVVEVCRQALAVRKPNLKARCRLTVLELHSLLCFFQQLLLV